MSAFLWKNKVKKKFQKNLTATRKFNFIWHLTDAWVTFEIRKAQKIFLNLTNKKVQQDGNAVNVLKWRGVNFHSDMFHAWRTIAISCKNRDLKEKLRKFSSFDARRRKNWSTLQWQQHDMNLHSLNFFSLDFIHQMLTMMMRYDEA